MANDVASHFLSSRSPRDPVLSLPVEDSLNLRKKRNFNDIACAHTHIFAKTSSLVSLFLLCLVPCPLSGGVIAWGHLLCSWGQLVRVPGCLLSSTAQLPLLILFQTWHHLNPGEMCQRPERMKASRWPTAICPKAWDHLIDGAKYPAM